MKDPKEENIIPMIKEPIILEKHYFDLSRAIINAIQDKYLVENKKLVIGICGESGSGKTVTAQCLQQTLSEFGKKAVVLHMDSYFKLPPTDNHQKRKSDIGWVGSQEVNTDLLDHHIQSFRNHIGEIKTPVVDYLNNLFTEERIDLSTIEVLIVEGVYTFYLSNIDVKIFLERDYKDTIDIRKERSREIYDTFVEQVLELEHQLAIKQKPKADFLVSKDYQLFDNK